MPATALAGVVAGPVSGAILVMHGLARLSGWQWLFILEGLPALILGIVVLRYLPNSPQTAAWLSRDESEALAFRLQQDRRLGTIDHRRSFAEAISNSTVWILSLVYFGIVFGLYGVTFWLPQITSGLAHRSDFGIGMLSALPFVGAAFAMVLIGRSSDLSGERRWHFTISAIVGASCLLLASMTRSPFLSLVSISIAASRILGTFGPFWATASGSFTGTAAAGSIALINSIGNLGGFTGPYIVGMVKQSSHSFAGGMLVMAASVLSAGLVALAMTGSSNEIVRRE